MKGVVALAFELAGGSTTGRDHRQGAPSNCQDAYAIHQAARGITALVADGCGSGKHSEVGAKSGVRMATTILHRYLSQGIAPSQRMLDQLQYELLSQLRFLATLIDVDNFKQTINDYLLFTLGGIIITEEVALMFAFGDGVGVVNGEVTVIEPKEGNLPPYISYALTGTSLTHFDTDSLRFRIIAELPAGELQSFLIGTDGVNAILNNPARPLPGRDELVGEISQFWQNDLFFRNSAALARRLNLIARDRSRVIGSGRQITDAGLLPDDTTLVVGRQRNLEGGS